MYSLSRITDFISLDNQECSCFGGLKQAPTQFLIKQTIPQQQATPSLTPEQSFSKNGGKRSLRRSNTGLYLQKTKDKRMDTLENSSHQRVLPQRQLIHFTSPQRIRTQYSHPQPYPRQSSHNYAFQTPPPPMFYPIPPQRNPVRGSPQSEFTTPTMFLRESLPARIMSPQQTTSLKIIYNNPASSEPAFSNLKAYDATSARPKEVFSCQDLQKQEKSPTSISRTEPQSYNNIPSSSLTNMERQSSTSPQQEQLQPIPSLQPNNTDINSLASEPSEHILLSPSADGEFSFDQHSPPLKYSWERELAALDLEPARLSWQLRAERHQMTSLKKMDDVMEICSQADSEQDSNSGKQSIVVGRLNEYASMMQAKVESASTIEQSIQNRLTGIGSLNSTIGHCQLKRKSQMFI